MINFEFEGTNYSMVESWEEATLGMWANYASLEKDDEESDLSFARRIIEIFSNAPLDTFDSMTMKQINVLSNKLGWISGSVKSDDVFPFEINGVQYHPINIMDIRNNEYEMMHKTLKAFPKESDWLPIIVSILLRPATAVMNEDGTTRWQTKAYDKNDLQARQEILLQYLPVGKCLGLKEAFFALSNQ